MANGERTRQGAAWSRRGVLSTTALMGTAGLTGGLAGCSGEGSGDSDDKLKKKVDNPPDNLNKKGFPIVDDPVTVQFMTSKRAHTADDYNKVANWKEYQKMTNIRVSWGLVPDESIEEKRNLALSSGDYPGAFFGAGLSVQDIGKYGNQGVFIKLNDLIDNYMPNLKKVLKSNSDIKRGATFPDGSIIGMPYGIDPDFTGMRIEYKLWARGDWLDKFDMDAPKTTDEYYKFLKKVKSSHPNGKDRAVPFGSPHKGGFFYSALRGAFGVGNRGQPYVDADPSDDNKVRFFPVTEGYKALMEYLNRLYSQGLIEKNIFSIDEAKSWQETGKGVYGSTVEIAPYNMRGGAAKNFVPLPSLKGPDGDNTYNLVNSTLMDLGHFVITDKCKHPVAVARWADYFYSDEGAKLYFMGVKDKSYKETSDGVEYVDKIKHPPHGKNVDDAKKPYVTYQGGTTAPIIIKEAYFKGTESTDESKKAAELLKPDAQKDVWPPFTYTADEFQQLDSLADDIEKYVDESRDKFISGDLKLPSWDKYVEKIKSMGLDDYLKIQQAAYDRFRKG